MVGGAVAPLLITHASADPRFREHPGLQRHGIESYIAVPLHRRDGSYFGTLCTLDPRPTALTDEAFAVFHLLADLIAFELEADERQQRREAEVRALEDFVAIAAHDLRQPLTALAGRIQLLARKLRRGTPAAELAQGVEILGAQVRRAVALSEVLLDVARMEAGGFTLARQPLDLVALAREVLDEVRATAPAHTFLLEAPPTLVAPADPRRLGQVLRNLLENAAKYAPPESGPVVLRLEAAPADAPEAIRLSVRDAGLGVEDDQLGRIFERRYRAPRAEAEGIGGSGLGLYIVRRIVAAHGGMVHAERAPEGGLLVRLDLPRV